MLKPILFLGLYAIAGVFSLVLAFLFRFELNRLPEIYAAMARHALPVTFFCKGLTVFFFGLHRYDWRFAAFGDLRRLFGAALTGSLLFTLVIYSVHPRFPRGPLLLDFLITFSAFATIRFSGRLWIALRRTLNNPASAQPRLPLLILGNGPTAEAAFRFLAQSHTQTLRVTGFVSENSRETGALIHGVPVLGALTDLPDLLQSRDIAEVIIALEDTPQTKIRDLYVLATANGCKVRIVSKDMLTPKADPSENPIRKLNLADFLGRPAVTLDETPVREALRDQSVLITGAGGSIGSELSRQTATLPVTRLILLDLSENALFEIAEELQCRETCPDFDIELCDIRHEADLRRILEAHRPDVIFHAAACKHVSMMERHPFEAVKTNVLGTRTLLTLAAEVGVKRFLHVSTDKAVDSVGIMGASKAMGEQLVLAAGENTPMICSCVRFGNVLGSNGSVIPLFEKQLRRGGPLRVTHAEATRYFMTLEEAVTLMLQAEALRENGRIFVLDMGEPVNIMAMAEQIRELHHAETGTRPDVKIIGLRPGEKIHEVLLSKDQRLAATRIPKVNTLEGKVLWEEADREKRLDLLDQSVKERKLDQLKKALFSLPAAAEEDSGT
ncbi:MAG: polysaccharide biosynthesis protein [Verrucomicrobia bacterium]|nr:polysaccharide biosynthesis protein [Verrucomicrobiota bacterium]MCH8529178.1 polysaccharide biosynthesis protein [Kiritimatiellia bacterium]